MTCILDDDESEIEAEIQRELDALQDDSLHVEDFESYNSLSKTNESKEDFLPDSLQEYIRLLQLRTEGAEEEVKECEIILERLPDESTLREDETLLAKRIKDELGEECAVNPLVLRDKVLSELEKAERHEKVREAKDDNDQLALDIIHPDVIAIDEISALEETAQQQLQELEEKQASKDQKRKEWFEKQKKEEEARKAAEKEARAKRQIEFEVAERKLFQEQEALQTKLHNEAREEEGRLQVMEEQFQAQLMVLEEERKKQSEAFVEALRKEAEYQQKKVEAAATKLQKFYRGFRIRKQYKSLLEARRLKRLQRKKEELDAVERVEKRVREEAEKRKVEEERRRKEQEEKKKIEEQEKLKRQEQAEKIRKLEEEQRKRDAEKRRKEEEHRRRVEKERKKQELEEQKRRKAEEQKQREAEQRGKIEEQRRKAEEENRQKIEEAKTQEEEDRRRTEEAKREEEEMQLKESEEKMMQEQRKTREEEEEPKKKDGERKIGEGRRKELANKEQVEEGRREEENKWHIKLIVSNHLLVATTENKFTEKKDVLNSKQSRQQEENNSKEENFQLGCALSLRHDLERRRQKWVQEHTPWSKMSTVDQRTHAVAKNRRRRAFSAAKHLPTLTEEQLLNSCPNVPLHKVKVIILKNLPSCGMQGISRCPDLQSLVLHNCGVLAVEGLEQCKQLLQLYIEENQVEAINCKDLSNLEEISLKNNNLTSVHGLEGCLSMKLLDLCNNKITRIGDLSSCGKLQRLLLDNNQLINTKGLTSVPCLQNLSLAHNHLAFISDIERCVLLQSLNLQSNNLQEAPQLVNCVLLRELHLDDNSISSLESLSTSWLPSLQILSVSQNSLSQCASLSNLLVLDTLDISNNLISDTNSLISGLQECGLLRILKIVGNPVHEEPSCRTAVLEALPSLTILDDESLSQDMIPIIKANSFTAMCLQQLQDQDALSAGHQREIRAVSFQQQNPEAILQRLRLVSLHSKEWFELAVKHLQQHENFNPSSTSVNMKDINSVVGTVGETSGSCDSMIGELQGTNTQAVESLNPHAAATKIQALWRGWHIRHLIDAKVNKWMAAVTIQAAWRGYLARLQFNKETKERWDPIKHSAATVIQAHFRGQRVRRRLADALQAAQCYYESDEEFDYDEEVDLSAFDFDENTLEEGWIPSNTPQLPPRGPVLKQPAQTSWDLDRSLSRDILNDTVTLKPRQAWRPADSPIPYINQPPVAKATMDHDARSVTSGMQSHVSHRAEELSNEWGFRNYETAELMIRRARKMKYNPARRKKMLDPNKRLALFKKLEETNKLRDVRPPPNRKQPPKRVEYFSAREAMAAHMASQSPSTEQTKEQLTFSWVYRQAVVHEDEERNIMADHTEYELENRSKKTSPEKSSRSSVSLPYMDRAVLSGRTLPLVSSPLFSHSAVETSPEGNSARSNSFSSGGHVRFPAIKTHSVPNLLARSTANGEQSMRTEKSNSAGARINRETRNRR